MSFKAVQILPILTFLLYQTHALDYDYDLSNLGSQISQQVQESLRPLNNLGSRISQRVHKQLDADLAPVRQLPSKFDNLGATISKQVYDGLRPVREMQARLRVKFGTGGTTVATFNDKQFIIRDGVMYKCVNGKISTDDGTCSGTLEKFKFDQKTDFCYSNINTVINNWYCIGNGNINSGAINGKVFCTSNDGTPTLLISQDEYRNLCQNVANEVTYKFFTNEPLVDYPSDVTCSGSGPRIVCTMKGSNKEGVSNVVVTGRGSFVNYY